MMNDNGKIFFYVSISGGIGGVGILVFNTVVNTAQGEFALWNIFSHFFLGAIAAILGVFVISKTDTTHLYHTLGLALAFGLSWQVVIDSAGQLVNQRIDTKRVNEVVNDAANTEKIASRISREIQTIEGNVDAEQKEKLYKDVKDLRNNVISLSTKIDEYNIEQSEALKKSSISLKRAIDTVNEVEKLIPGDEEISVKSTIVNSVTGIENEGFNKYNFSDTYVVKERIPQEKIIKEIEVDTLKNQINENQLNIKKPLKFSSSNSQVFQPAVNQEMINEFLKKREGAFIEKNINDQIIYIDPTTGNSKYNFNPETGNFSILDK